MRKSHHIYVVELSRRVWRESSKFRFVNQHFTGRRCCLYVGITSQTPEERFAKHKAGFRTKKGIKISSKFVEKYGLYLRPSLYRHLNPLTKSRAAELEGQLAEALRRRGYAVWWN